MATQRSSFAKRERDRAKKAKAAAKREARLERSQSEPEDEEPQVQTNESAEEIMAKLAKLHEAFDDNKIDFETFEEQKAELMARMPIE